ncbi:hypothetical protein QZH41_003618 [Actinostola sp. cb2023]|nr:hypothetical protein QZH41_003618 [Actinostola sp. cb2023]
MRVGENQLDHFLSFITSPHIIQDLPFGQQYLRLTSGEVLETPNVIRSIIPQRIVQQYQQFCDESDFKPFGKSTMLRILSCCRATVRKSLQGLDYIVAEGAKAFDDLQSLIERLEITDIHDRNILTQLKKDLKDGKHYLKTDYKVHIAEESEVGDHCSTYALNDSKDAELQTICLHKHDHFCERCEVLKNALSKLENILMTAEVPNDERDDMLYTYQQATQAVHAWKAHQLRSIRQDMCRTDVLDNCLDGNSVLITQDWAMKLLPLMYRETQSDWFAKRGLSWHISVAVVKLRDVIQQQAFIHIAENCSQDSLAVIRILEHNLRTLKQEHPELSQAYLRQDNAGCYHSASTLTSCQQMKELTGISVARADFSDPQGGKGPCDRKAAVVKAHVRRYVNEGHDVKTANDFKEAILSHGGIKGVRVAVVNASPSPRTVDCSKWDGISLLNNFTYSKEGIITWRAYNVGKGKLVTGDNLQAPDFSHCQFKTQFSPGDFVDITSTRKSGKQSKPVQKEESHPQQIVDNALFTCPNSGCTNEYQRHSGLEKHLLFGKCQLAPERETLMDKAKVLYTAKLSEGASAKPLLAAAEVQGNTEDNVVLPVGWALKSSSKSTRFNSRQKNYLDNKFRIGQETGHKADPATVAHDMRYSKDSEGKRLFRVDEFLTHKQIKSYFSRKSAKVRSGNATDIQDVAEEDEIAAEEQQNYDDARQSILQEVQLKHPIVYDTYNVCSMQTSNTFTKLSVSVLRSMCEYFDLPVNHIKAHRKAPYLVLVKELVQSCTCCK